VTRAESAVAALRRVLAYLLTQNAVRWRAVRRGSAKEEITTICSTFSCSLLHAGRHEHAIQRALTAAYAVLPKGAAAAAALLLHHLVLGWRAARLSFTMRLCLAL